MKLTIKSRFSNYDIFIKNSLLDSVEDYVDINQKYVIISDDNIPNSIIEKFTKKIDVMHIIRFPSGERSKCLDEYSRIINFMIKNYIKKDIIILAIGGGVTGDLAGFVAATLYRGVPYIQVPTSLLSQIDSSVGGKVAINSEDAKNSIGCFYPPKMVLIDPETLKTLPQREFNNGMAEMIKYSLIASKTLFEFLRNDNVYNNLETLIYESLKIKKHFVEADEFDNGIRQILNFGHTFGHAYEVFYEYKKYLHGEAIALGMLKTINPDLKRELVSLLKKYNLPIEDSAKSKDLLEFIKRDKKAKTKSFNLIKVDEIGSASIKELDLETYEKELLR
jgi:3-dehydroquinate synthase